MDITQPGTYYANLRVASEDVYNMGARMIPVQMTVTPSATLGKLDGNITGLGYCDANPAPLNRGVVTINDGTTDVASLFTDVDGYYQYWLNAGTYTVTASDNGHGINSAVVIVNAGVTSTAPINLRWIKPCVNTTSDSLSANLTLGVSTTLPITFANTGAGSASWFVREQNRGFSPLAPTVGPDILVLNGSNAGAGVNDIQAITRTLEGLGYAVNSGYVVTGAWYLTGTVANLNDYKYVIFVGLPFGNTTPGTVIPDRLDVLHGQWRQPVNQRRRLCAYSLPVSGAALPGAPGELPANPLYCRRRRFTRAGSRSRHHDGRIPLCNRIPHRTAWKSRGTLGVGIFQNPDPRSGWAGTRVAHNGYRAMYLGRDFNLTDSSTLNTITRMAILQRALNWLTPDDVDWLSEDVTGGSLPPDNGCSPSR